MVRFSFFSCALVFSLTCKAQQFFELTLESEDKNITRSIADYSRKKLATSHLDRLEEIDSVASLRSQYYLNVLKQSYSGSSFQDLLSLIPKGKTAHKRFFGNPYIFSEPEGLTYPHNLVFIPSIVSKIKAEIMQQIFLSVVSNKSLAPDSLVKKTLNYYKKLGGKDFVLEAYKSSKDHHDAIIKYGKNKMGTSTKALIAKRWLSDRERWKYEILIYNVVLFAE